MKKKNDYFKMLAAAAEFSCDAARQVAAVISKFQSSDVKAMADQLHEIEHDADRAHHNLMENLSTEFITPIEREDIVALGDALDDVVDDLEDIVLRFYIFNVSELRPESNDFAQILVKQTESLLTLMKSFKDFKHPKRLKPLIVEINNYEEQGDTIYFGAIHRLYTEEASPVDILRWTEIFRRMESCCDDIEDVAQLVEKVMLKNS